MYSACAPFMLTSAHLHMAPSLMNPARALRDTHVPRTTDGSPWMRGPFRPPHALLAGVSSSVAPCVFSALAGRHDDGDVICLTRRAVNTPHPSMKSERVVV